MAASLGQGGWSVRTCMLKTEPETLNPDIRHFWGILRVAREREGAERRRAAGDIPGFFTTRFRAVA